MCKWGTHTKVRLMEIDLKGLTKKQNKKRAKILGLTEREELIDSCIAPLVQILNDYGIKTISCCCGHGKVANSHIRISAKNIEIIPLGDTLTVHLKFPYPERKK